MPTVLVAGAADVLDRVRGALPEMNVVPAPALDANPRAEADCVVIETGAKNARELELSLAKVAPIVHLFRQQQKSNGPSNRNETPSAHIENPAEVRLAVRLAMLQHRVETLLVDLTGPWAHDARGALGVARLGLELLRAGTDPASATQKVENGVLRLGWLMERLPPQVALALDLPLALHAAPSLFPTLESYVVHLRLTHSRRAIELSGGDWSTNAASQPLVPFAAGFAELAFKLSSPRTTLRFSTEHERRLEVECECPERPEPWNVQETIDAVEMSHRHNQHLPYRLIEVARLALRSSIPLTVQFTPRAFLARVQLGSPSAAS